MWEYVTLVVGHNRFHHHTVHRRMSSKPFRKKLAIRNSITLYRGGVGASFKAKERAGGEEKGWGEVAIVEANDYNYVRGDRT